MNNTMILINATYGLTNDHPSHLMTSQLNYEPVSLDGKVMKILLAIIDELGMQDELAFVSGYRSIQSQIDTWDYCLTHHGLDYTKRYVAKPGHSEHHSALAIDIGSNIDPIDYIAPILVDNEKTKRFKQALYDHGFILRYPANKTMITGIDHEPWHFRYIGTPHSRYVMDHDLCYEEYIDQLKHTDKDHPLLIDDSTIAYGLTTLNGVDDPTISYIHEGFYVVTRNF